MSDESRTVPSDRRRARLARRLRVEVVAGLDTGKSIEGQSHGSTSIGVASDNALVLTDPTVSRYHLELRPGGDGFEVVDLGSSNGTIVGDVRIVRAIVPPDTRLRLGDTVVELRDGEPVGPGEAEGSVPIEGLVAESEAMRAIVRVVRQIGPSDVSVLLQGETGTGKEVIAEAIHATSPRKDAPFEIVDCASMAPTLIASELFGHERGAFTGADRQHIGAFERANGGTVFLDEIGELPVDLQPALLGVLERQRFRRVGGSKEIGVDVRVVAATHRELRSAVNDGTFRADLYFRVAAMRIVIPPLRERPEDVDALVRHFARQITGDPTAEPFGISTLERLRAHRWSGNVRELRNVVESALAMGRVRLDGTDLGPAGETEEPGGIRPYKEARAAVLTQFEHAYLRELIDRCGGNASEAARRARMDRPYLLSLLRKHGLRG